MAKEPFQHTPNKDTGVIPSHGQTSTVAPIFPHGESITALDQACQRLEMR